MGGLKIAIVLYFGIFCKANGLPRVDPLVDTEVGLIRGLTSDDGSYSMFMGIPYATVNASNPFGESIPHPGFEGTFDAFDDSAACPQINEFTNMVDGHLDCLHLNVYVPSTASSANRLPVMVWIHGGGFAYGFAGRYVHGPSYLVRHDVILVTLNYRLGPYGFMCLHTPEVPGNQGLKDQLAALRWIKSNIAAFGGDNEQITIFGESAGGASVDLQLLYAKENLFNKVIMQSGTALMPFAVNEPDLDAPLKLAQRLGLVTTDVNEALRFLGSVDSDLIIAATNELGLGMGACVEKEFDNVERFITDYPINIDVNNKGNTPILLGFTDQEMLLQFLFLPSEGFALLGNMFQDSLRASFNFDDQYLGEMAKNVRQFYIGDEELSDQLRWDFIDFSSDVNFVHPTYRTIEKYSSNPKFCYVFGYNGQRNFVKRRLNVTEGSAAHADEISYLFDVSFFEDTPTAEDQLIIDRMSTLWTNFAKDSNPTPEVTELLPVELPAVTADSLSFLMIDLNLEVVQRPYHDRIAYWDLFFKMNQEYEKGYSNN